MAATLAQIRAGIITNLGSLQGGVSAVQLSAYILSNPTPPTIQIMGPEEVIWDMAMGRGLDEWNLTIQGFVGSPTDIGAQVLLDQWLDPADNTSVKKAVESDKTLGGIVENAQVVSTTGYRIYNLDSHATSLGAEWAVRIYNTGK